MMGQQETLLQFFKAVGQVERLKVLGLLANRPYNTPELAKTLGMKETAVMHHLRVLQESQLITQSVKDRVQVNALNQRQLIVLNRQMAGQVDRTTETIEMRVARHYRDGEQLKEIPVNLEERMVILRWVVGWFENGRFYPEAELNHVLQQHFADFATLRRYLIDYRLMQRANGQYWRVDGEAVSD